jgi:hypothetical protein
VARGVPIAARAFWGVVNIATPRPRKSSPLQRNLLRQKGCRKAGCRGRCQNRRSRSAVDQIVVLEAEPEGSHREAVDVLSMGKLQHNTPRRSRLEAPIGTKVLGASGPGNPPRTRTAEHRPRSPVHQTGECKLELELWQHALWKSDPQECGPPAPSKYSAPNAVCPSANSPVVLPRSATRCPTPCCPASNAPSVAATSTTSSSSPRRYTSLPRCSLGARPQAVMPALVTVPSTGSSASETGGPPHH